MAESIALAPDASRLASLLLSYMPAVCAFVAPRHPGASAAIIDRLSHSRALSADLDVGARRRKVSSGPTAQGARVAFEESLDGGVSFTPHGTPTTPKSCTPASRTAACTRLSRADNDSSVW